MENKTHSIALMVQFSMNILEPAITLEQLYAIVSMDMLNPTHHQKSQDITSLTQLITNQLPITLQLPIIHPLLHTTLQLLLTMNLNHIMLQLLIHLLLTRQLMMPLLCIFKL